MTVDDEGAPYHHGKHCAETDLTFCLKRQLDAAQQRIKRLENIIHRAKVRFFFEGADKVAAAGMLEILDEAKESKP